MSIILSRVVSFFIVIFSFLPQPTYIEGVVGQPQSINPLKVSTNGVDRDLSRLIFRGLMRYDENGQLITDLAERYQVSEDQKEYIFELRKKVNWHDGVEFTADDVLYTVSIHPRLKTLQVDKLDRYRVRFKLRDPYAPFLDLLTLGLVPSHLDSRMGDLNPVGTGDYRLARIKKSDKVDEVILISTDGINLFRRGNPSRLIFKFYPNSSDLITAAKLGEISGFALEDFVPSLHNFNQFRMPLGSRYYAIFFNLKNNENIKNKDFRRDIAKSIPKGKIIDNVYQGYAVPAYLPLEYTFASMSGIPRDSEDIDMEKKYNINLGLSVPKKEIHVKTAEIIKEELLKIGVNLNILEIDPEKLTSEVISRKDFDMMLLGQEIERDPDVYTLWHSTQENLPGLNFSGFESVLADKALEEGRKTGILNDRIRHYQNFQRVFSEEVPAVLLYRPILTYSIKTNISNISLKGIYKGEDRFANISEWLIH